MAPAASSATLARGLSDTGRADSASISSHTADPLLAPFLRSTFDPTAYLNSILPPLAIASTQQPIIPAKHASLQDLASQTSSHLAKLGAQQSQLVDVLTGLTDDILRSGSRLAYEVEILRGEAAALEEVLVSESVREDLERFFVSEDKSNTGKEDIKPASGEEVSRANAELQDSKAEATTAEAGITDVPKSSEHNSQESLDPNAPPALSRLRTLQEVRTNLSRVISIFDAALSFPLPPSLLASHSSSSSFVSVAPPSDPALEASGKEALDRLHASIVDKYDSNKPDGSADAAGIARAEARLAELRDLCTVWKGTSEEKARTKVLEGWEREVAEARTRLGVRGEEGGALLDTEEAGRSRRDGTGTGDVGGRRVRADSSGSRRDGRADSRDAPRERRGLFGGLRRLRDEIYLE